MRIQIRRLIPAPLFLLAAALACNYPGAQATQPPAETPISSPAAVLEATEPPPGLLTVCMGQEPASLFMYADGSAAARAIRQAIYDGPYDIVDYQFRTVILQEIPTLANAGVGFEPVNVQTGSLIIDADGRLVQLAEGVRLLPAGCADESCAVAYSGASPVQMDQMTVQYRLLPGLTWSDGEPLTADDSVYAFELARGLYPRVRADLMDRTVSYRVIDEQTVEWRGLPGYRASGYPAFFFSPLPRHAWGGLTQAELQTAEAVNRAPLGWGPYRIDEWVDGDHVTLSRNPSYFRASEGLPAFDRLVFRFVPDREQALSALLAGECDLLDESLHLEVNLRELVELRDEGKVSLLVQPAAAWEHLDFGIQPFASGETPAAVSLFAQKETRQAVALCVDRARLASEVMLGEAQILDSYVPAAHPLVNPEVRRYSFDPATGTALLEQVGWKDLDGSPATPRIAQGVAGVVDGTAFEVGLHTTDDPEKTQAAAILQESLAQCGIKVVVSAAPQATVFAPGPEGPVFGRSFQLAQFGWVSSVEPACFLYTTSEIPGPYPEHPKGWGGANITGYSSPEFDRACRQALASLPEAVEHRTAHFQAQLIFTEELPSIPLYSRNKIVAARPDFCGVDPVVPGDSALWNIETFKYGETCP